MLNFLQSGTSLYRRSKGSQRDVSDYLPPSLIIKDGFCNRSTQYSPGTWVWKCNPAPSKIQWCQEDILRSIRSSFTSFHNPAHVNTPDTVEKLPRRMLNLMRLKY